MMGLFLHLRNIFRVLYIEITVVFCKDLHKCSLTVDRKCDQSYSFIVGFCLKVATIRN